MSAEFFSLVHSLYNPCLLCYVNTSFQAGYTNLKRFVPKNQHTQRKLLNFENWVNGKVSKSDKIWLSKSIFYVKNHRNLSHFLPLKNINFGAHSLLLALFDNISVCRFKSLAALLAFAGQLTGAGGTPRLSYLPCKR
jgi:hypothetical protein